MLSVAVFQAERKIWSTLNALSVKPYSLEFGETT